MRTIPNRAAGESPGRALGRRWRSAIPVAAGLALLLGASSARADLVLSIAPVSITETSSSFTDTFQVNLTNQSDSSSPSVSVFTLELQLSNLPGVQFVDVSQNTTDGMGNNNYIFNGIGSVAAGVPGFLFSNNSFPNTDFIASDSDWLGSTPTNGTLPAVTLNVGDTYGLALVTFGGSGVPNGTALVNFAADLTTVLDTNGNPVTLDVSSPAASITVSSTTVVPEPSAASLMAAAGATVLLAAGWSRRGGRRRAPVDR